MDERLETEEQSTDGSANGSPNGPQRDYQMDRIISVVLRGGVLLSAGLLILGALLYFVRVLWGGAPANPLSFPHSLGDVFSGLGAWRSIGDPHAGTDCAAPDTGGARSSSRSLPSRASAIGSMSASRRWCC